MKKFIIAILGFILLLLINTLEAQLSVEQKSLVLKDIAFYQQKYSLDNPSKISQDQFLSRNDAKKEIAKAISNKNLELAELFFDEYASILDTLVVSNL